MKALSDEYHLTVMPISLDGATSTYFPNTKSDNGIVAKLGVQDAPAIFIVNPDTQQTIPLGYGVIPTDEIESRIRRLVIMQPGEF